MERKMRVCAYCRVSTRQEKSETSLTSQILYYTNLIESNPEYINAGIFVDNGISGKYQSKRKDFQNMIKECRSGNVDIIYTKTLTRFGRNMMETLNTLEELVGLGIDVIFESDNMTLLKDRSAIEKAIKSYLAEKELENDANAVKFAIQRRMEQGHFSVNPNTLLGYKYNSKGELVIVPDEAKIIKEIFKRYVAGEKVIDIIKSLNERGYRSSAGCLWNYCNFAYIIKQEKYAGVALLQKYFSENGHRYRNNGDMRQYWVENSHPAIVPMELWEKAQERRKAGIKYDRPRGYVPKYDCFRGIMKCGICGANYNKQGLGHKTLKHGGKEKETYQCNTNKMHGVHACRNRIQDKLTLQDGFIAIFNKLKELNVDTTKQVFETTELREINERLQILYEKEKTYLQLKVNDLLNSAFQKEYDKLLDEVVLLGNRKKEISKRNIEILSKNEQNSKFMEMLNSMDKMTEFSDVVFTAMVESITVMNKNLLIYHLKNGMTAKVKTIDYYLERDEIEGVEIC